MAEIIYHDFAPLLPLKESDSMGGDFAPASLTARLSALMEDDACTPADICKLISEMVDARNGAPKDEKPMPLTIVGDSPAGASGLRLL